jgi:3-deoxy-D-manno-octulosonic-acid transferase
VFFSVILRSNQLFFSWYGKWFRNQLTQITKIFVQDGHSQELAMDFGIANVEIAGDTRFDRVLDTVEKSEKIPFLSEFKGRNKIIVFGSAWGVETRLALQIIKSLPEGWKVIYAPHEIDHDKIAQFQSEISAPSVLFTELHSFNVRDAQVLIVNTIGHLARMYKYGDVAVIGGGFNDGIHNILEPLAFGLPVIFGPNHIKFFEAELVINDKVGFEIQTLSQGQELIHQILGNEVDLVEKRSECQKFISNNIGATPKVSQYLETLL